MSDPRIAQQIELEHLFNKNQTIPRVKREFTECSSFNFADYMNQKKIPIPFGFDLLAQMALHRRCPLTTLIGVLRHHFNDSQLTADMILKAAEADLFDWLPQFKQCVVRFTISEDVQEELDKYQFPLPMVVEPREITNNLQTGMLTSGGSVILKKNHHEDDVCLDHLNRVNKIKFVINNKTAIMIKNQWRNLDRPKEGETKDDFLKRKKAFEKYDRIAHKVITELNAQGNEFFLTHRYDKRGRIYCQGYHVNYQGAAWNKAVIELANKEFVE